ncbi:uncharacterized protein [Diadema setosum]|uniref:uncharacterized protein n=1 Tax=Diadema setosum TaxID=31175 RepID=UPI003B3A3DD5
MAATHTVSTGIDGVFVTSTLAVTPLDLTGKISRTIECIANNSLGNDSRILLLDLHDLETTKDPPAEKDSFFLCKVVPIVTSCFMIIILCCVMVIAFKLYRVQTKGCEQRTRDTRTQSPVRKSSTHSPLNAEDIVSNEQSEERQLQDTHPSQVQSPSRLEMTPLSVSKPTTSREGDRHGKDPCFADLSSDETTFKDFSTSATVHQARSGSKQDSESNMSAASALPGISNKDALKALAPVDESQADQLDEYLTPITLHMGDTSANSSIHSNGINSGESDYESIDDMQQDI